jgi:site-specific recombinase XerD
MTQINLQVDPLIGTLVRNVPTLAIDIYKNDDLQDWIGIFLHACRSRNLATGTIKFYSMKLNTFVQFSSDLAITNISQITADNIRQFLIYLVERKHKPAGVHCYYRSVKTFLKWYEREVEPAEWRNPINKVKAPIVPLEPLDPVSIETIKAMMETCKRGQLTDARDCAALLVLLDSGLRISEFLALNKADINLITGEILVRAGKGRRPRTAYLGDTSRRMLRKYLNLRTDYNCALWIIKTGERLTATGLVMMLRRRSAKAGTPVPSPHDFRRAFAIERWRAGVDILTLSKLMGHTSLQVLSRYIKQVGEDLAQASKQSSPVDLNF